MPALLAIRVHDGVNKGVSVGVCWEDLKWTSLLHYVERWGFGFTTHIKQSGDFVAGYWCSVRVIFESDLVLSRLLEDQSDLGAFSFRFLLNHHLIHANAHFVQRVVLSQKLEVGVKELFWQIVAANAVQDLVCTNGWINESNQLGW